MKHNIHMIKLFPPSPQRSKVNQNQLDEECIEIKDDGVDF